MSIVSIENLSNDFFYELFDYLDGCHIYLAFSKLNHRFEQLLTSPSLLLRIKLDDSTYDAYCNDYYEHFIYDNRHHVYSLSLETDEYYSPFALDLSFVRLESLVLRDMESTVVCSILTACISLPRVFSLTVDMESDSEGLTDIYRAIFALPNLKYLKCLAYHARGPIALSLAPSERISSIERLILEHSCSSKELAAILSYVPQLRRLKYSHRDYNASVLSAPIKLLNLTSIVLDLPCIEFDELEGLLAKLDCPLQALSFKTQCDDESYLDGARWEALIIKCFPRLKYLKLECVEEIESEDGSVYLADCNRFTSSFWLDRKWTFESEVDSCMITHRIRPYQKRWYDMESSNECAANSARLLLTCLDDDDDLDFPIPHIADISTVTQFNHLECQRETINFNTLINITNQFAELDSLKLHSISFSSPRVLPVEKVIRALIMNDNRITKIQLEKLTKIEDVYFLLKLCPRLSYLHIDCINTIHVKCFVEGVVNKLTRAGNGNFRFLSFHTTQINDAIIEELQAILTLKELAAHCVVHCHLDKIALQWRK